MGIRVVQPSGKINNKYFSCLDDIQCIMGPVGSGKSTTSIMKMLTLGMYQPKDPFDGVRRCRFAVIRNTKVQLKETTIRTFHSFIPKDYGAFRENNGTLTHEFSVTHDDGGRVDFEFDFIPLDKEEDIQRLLSLELTGAFINEAREVPGKLLSSLYARTGRYPAKVNGGSFWHGVMMDTNSFDPDNWIYKMFVEKKTDGYTFFRQPSGLSADAENIENLPENYYQNLVKTAISPEWVDMYVHAKFGYSRDGKPVFPEFSDNFHVAAEEIKPVDGIPLQVGFDAGRTPAAVVCQVMPNGQFRVLAEFDLEKTGPIEFSKKFMDFCSKRFSGFPVEWSERSNWADPAAAMGDSPTDPSWIRTVENETGLRVRPAPGDNSIGPRLDAVKMILKENIDGEPAFLLSPACAKLRKGFNSGYCYKRLRSGKGENFEDVPDKNTYSHLQDALQYVVLGNGGYEKAVGLKKTCRAGVGKINTRSEFNAF